jgi:hypothetical protein
MNFIAVLSYEHLDNGMFLTAFARSLAQKKSRGIILHGDSEYTERLIQTGIMREDAVIRSVKDLNHRLVALFADQGVSTIGVNSYQKSMVVKKGDDIIIDKNQIEQLPEYPMLLISNLVNDQKTGKPAPVSLSQLALAFQKTFSTKPVTIFSIKDSSNVIKEDFPKVIQPHTLNETYRSEYLPKEFQKLDKTLLITTADRFGND